MLNLLKSLLDLALSSLEYIVPLLAVFLSYSLGHLQSGASEKANTYRSRYEEFYVPFIQRIYGGFLWKVPYSSFVKGGQDVFFDLLFQKISCIDERTQSMLPDFYMTHLECMSYFEGDRDDDTIPERMDAIFYRLTESVLSEASSICKELSLPDISKTALYSLQTSSLTRQYLTPTKN